MTQIMILKRDAIESVPRTPLPGLGGARARRRGRSGTGHTEVWTIKLPPPEVSPTPSVSEILK